MKKHYFLLLLLCPLFSIAQGNYQPGYIINLKGDTIKGFIDYRQWGNNPASINFKKNKSLPAERYTADNTQAFVVNDFACSYKRYTVKISLDKIDLSTQIVDIDSSSTTATVFLKLIRAGKYLSLYSYTDNIKTRYFIAESDLTPVELIYSKYITTENEKKAVTKTTYRQQLIKLVTRYHPDDSQLTKDINLASYSEGSLTKILIRANKADNKGKSRRSKNFDASLFLGLSLNNTVSTVTGDNSGVSNTQKSTQSSTYFFPELHFGTNILLGNKLANLIFRAEVTATYNVASFNTSGSSGGGYSYSNTANIKDFSVGINPQLLYCFNSKAPAKFYAGAGIAAYLIQSNYKKTGYSYYSGSTQVSGTDEDNSSVITAAATLKVGCAVNSRFDIYAGYNVMLGKLDNISIINFSSDPKVTDQSVYKIGINYTFGKR